MKSTLFRCLRRQTPPLLNLAYCLCHHLIQKFKFKSHHYRHHCLIQRPNKRATTLLMVAKITEDNASGTILQPKASTIIIDIIELSDDNDDNRKNEQIRRGSAPDTFSSKNGFQRNLLKNSPHLHTNPGDKQGTAHTSKPFDTSSLDAGANTTKSPASSSLTKSHSSS